MTLIDLLTIVACLIAGAFTIRLGNHTLRKQRIEKRRRQHEEAVGEMVGESETERTLRDLTLWREQGYLVATEASWKQLQRLATKDPEIVLELHRIVEHNAERTEGWSRKGKPAAYVEIKLADEDSKELRRKREKKPKDTLMVQAPLLAHR